ncbi:MAG: TM2 domain-containing protein [Algoriphagus sp.]
MENQESQINKPQSKRVGAALLAIFLGAIGIHKFYLGYKNAGIIQLVIWAVVLIISIISCGFGGFLFFPLWVVSLIEGIMYLTKSDDQFIEIYQLNKKEWF